MITTLCILLVAALIALLVVYRAFADERRLRRAEVDAHRETADRLVIAQAYSRQLQSEIAQLRERPHVKAGPAKKPQAPSSASTRRNPATVGGRHRNVQ